KRIGRRVPGMWKIAYPPRNDSKQPDRSVHPRNRFHHNRPRPGGNIVLDQVAEQYAELHHRQNGQEVVDRLSETDDWLGIAHLVRKWPSPGHDDQRHAALAERLNPAEQCGIGKCAAAKFDDGEAHLAPASRSLRTRSISTPTLPGAISSFSTRTTTRSTRGSDRTWVATFSASVSARSTWPRATIVRIPSMMMS